MDKDALQFYLESKNDFSFRAEEKLAQEREEKVADTLKQVAVNFAKKNPDIATHAITGGILGGASELAMPSEIDAMGRPSTNMTQIGKRALLGATMGGIGSGVKQHVKSKIDKLAEDKTAKAWETVKTVVKNNPYSVGVGVLGAYGGGRMGYDDYSKKDKARSASKKFLDTASGALKGGLGGAAMGSIMDNMLHVNRGGVSSKKLEDLMSPVFKKKNTKSIVKAEKSIGPGTVEKGKIIELPLNRKASASPIPKTDKSPKGTVIKFPEPEKLANALSPMLQRAGSLIAKNPRAASAALGAGTGLAANAVTGSDAPVFSAVAGGALGALGGKQLLRATVNRANPLLGKDVAQGAVGVMKQNRASQLALRSPKVVNMGATEAAASNLKGMSTPSPAGPRNVPVGNAAPAYSVKAQASNPASFTPTNQPKTSLTGVSFSPSATPAPTAQKADFMSAYRPTRSTANPSMNQARAAMPQTSYSPEMAQTLSKIAEIMKW